MKISTKGRYALRMMLDLAENQHDGYVSLKDIAARQEISKKYRLRQFNLDSQQTDELFDMLYLMAMEQYFENVWVNV